MLIVDGHDLTDFIIAGEYQVSREEINGPNAGRTMDAKMHLDYLTYKRKVEARFAPLTREEWNYIEHGVLRKSAAPLGNAPEAWHSVEFEDFGVQATMKAYSSSFGGAISTISGKRVGARASFIEE